MSWVSQANIKTIMTAIRNKFTTSDLVIANDAKDTGVELNYASQDGLVTVSPISTSASTEAALHLSNGDDTKKTELTQGTLSYVTGTGSSETYNYMSLLGDGVTFGKNGGGNVQLGGVADPTSARQVATKNYVDNYVDNYVENRIGYHYITRYFSPAILIEPNGSKFINLNNPWVYTLAKTERLLSVYSYTEYNNDYLGFSTYVNFDSETNSMKFTVKVDNLSSSDSVQIPDSTPIIIAFATMSGVL